MDNENAKNLIIAILLVLIIACVGVITFNYLGMKQKDGNALLDNATHEGTGKRVINYSNIIKVLRTMGYTDKNINISLEEFQDIEEDKLEQLFSEFTDEVLNPELNLLKQLLPSTIYSIIDAMNREEKIAFVVMRVLCDSKDTVDMINSLKP